jgi:hypothetical protein
VRLDHLLSKEHQAPDGSECLPGRPCFLVEHWLFILIGADGAASTLPLSRAAERAPGGAGGMGTLLGPEETGCMAWVFSAAGSLHRPGGVCGERVLPVS